MNPQDFPTLAASHITNAKLYATRDDMIADLPISRNACIAELGVGLGDFSKILIRTLKPSSFHAFDTFQLHLVEMLWGRKSSDVFRGMSHFDFYKREMESGATTVEIKAGPSQETLPRYPDGSFDMIYVDAEHTYDEVKADARVAAHKVKRDGILIFNDYILHDPFAKADYGIVPVVNEMVVKQGWRVIGFALQKHMFCDIAIRRN